MSKNYALKMFNKCLLSPFISLTFIHNCTVLFIYFFSYLDSAFLMTSVSKRKLNVLLSSKYFFSIIYRFKFDRFLFLINMSDLGVFSYSPCVCVLYSIIFMKLCFNCLLVYAYYAFFPLFCNEFHVFVILFLFFCPLAFA